MKNPYSVVISRRMTEKARVLENLQHATSNPSVSRCKSPKFVFNVSKDATKNDIARAVEEIYPKVRVVKVNTVNIGSKPRRMRGRLGVTSGYKKAIVTLQPGQTIDEQA
jgi:large subunit ribosomal protein L23